MFLVRRSVGHARKDIDSNNLYIEFVILFILFLSSFLITNIFCMISDSSSAIRRNVLFSNKIDRIF